jgi:uncharacterized membrane protein
VSNDNVDANRGSARAGPVSAAAGEEAWPTQDFVTTAATVGVIAAGVALFEVALIPGMVIGGAAVLAPRFLPNKYWPKLGRRLFNSTARRRGAPAVPRPDVRVPPAPPAGLGITQALAKTITFRIIVTTLDFTTNYVVIGEFATAAGLSTFNLVVGPLFYLAHETAWNYLGPSGNAVDLPALPPLRTDAKARLAGQGGFTISRAVAKTITFRTIATAMDFTTNYLVVGDLATAIGLSAFAFVVGPFVYLGHEMAWDHYGAPSERGREPTVDQATSTSLVPVAG